MASRPLALGRKAAWRLQACLTDATQTSAQFPSAFRKWVYQLRMSPLRLAQSETPELVAPHCVGKFAEHWMPQVPFVHRRVPLQPQLKLLRPHLVGTISDWERKNGGKDPSVI